jgi:NAD(P)-dependent dehydrogenase (short-subunit alcohol dehydrogenase family)
MSHTRKIIVLTGATKGLGRALVQEFVRAGHIVIGCGRNSDAIAELQKTFPAPHHFTAVDVREDKAVKAWAEGVLQNYAPPDLLLNNAAVINRSAPLWELSGEEFNTLISVNIIGVANVIRHFLPSMIAKRKGVVVNFSSGWGRSTAPDVAPYCASKYAIEGLTLALAQELPSGLAAIPLNPGIIDTEMLRSCFGSSARAYPKPEEWAKMAVPFLLKLSPRHNGKSLTVSGAATD